MRAETRRKLDRLERQGRRRTALRIALAVIVVAVAFLFIRPVEKVGEEIAIVDGAHTPLSPGKTLGPDSLILEVRLSSGRTLSLATTQQKAPPPGTRISALSRMAKALRMIPDRPDLPKQKEGHHRIRYYEQSEEADIHAKLREWDADGDMLDWSDYFTFLADMGTRPSEAQRFQWRDYRGGVCHFEETKNDLARSLKPTARVKGVLERQRMRHPKSAGPFAWVTERGSRTLWDKLRAHIKWMDDRTVIYTFRHTCASRLTMHGVSLHRIKAYLGHKTINTTLRYAHLAPEQVNIATEALETIHQQALAA